MNAKYKVRFAPVYTGTRAPRPVVVGVVGETEVDCQCKAICAAFERADVSDEGFRAYAERLS